VLSVAKALVVTLAFGILIAIRRPQYSLWPWAAVACVAVLAAAPQFQLRPLVVSILFLSVTLYLLFRLPHKANPQQFLIAIGVTFWLWANCDRWFFLGPLALALLVLGDLIQKKALNAPDDPPAEGDDEPLGRLPDTVTLAKALGIGVLVCMLNPHHVRVWDLPVELTKPSGFEGELRLRVLLLSPTDSLYVDRPELGYNMNGLAYAVLFLAGAALLGFGPARVRVAHIALFVGFAVLSLLSITAIPFFAVVAVPLIAAQLNAFSARVELKTWGDPKSRILFLGSSVGRIASILAVCALCAIAYPGWAHPDVSNPAYARRVAWGVESEPALAQAAGQFKTWRESGKLPADARGFVANIELANYIAWFAPQEKVFINARYNHHRRDLADYAAARRGLGLIDTKDEQSKLSDATDVLRKVGAEYVAIYASPNDGFALWNRATYASGRLYTASDEWSPWYADGRTTVFGWRPPGAPERPAFAALRVDPVLLAFGPNVERVKEAELQQPLKPLEWGEAFLRPAKSAPIGVTETIGWLQFKLGPAIRQERRGLVRDRLMAPLFFGAPDTAGTWHGFALNVIGFTRNVRFAPNDATDPAAAADADALRAIPLLALRAARRAIADDPDHPDGYYALAMALSDSDLPLTESERTLGRATALHQCLIRMPKPDRYKRGQFTAAASQIALELVFLYLGEPISGPPDPKTKQPTVKGYTGMPIDVPPLNDVLGQTVLINTQDPTAQLTRMPWAVARNAQFKPNIQRITGNVPTFLPLDVARKTLALALEYLPLDTSGDSSEEVKKRAERLEAYRKEVDLLLIRANEQYGQTKSRGANLRELVDSALHSTLPGEALEELTRDGVDLAKEYKENEAHAAILIVGLNLALGHVEDANEGLAILDRSSAAIEKSGLAPAVRMLKYQKALHAGDYKEAGNVLENSDGKRVGLEPILAEIAKSKITPQELLLADVSHWVPPLGRTWETAAFQQYLRDYAGRAFQVREALVSKMDFDSRYFYHRGVLALLEGDNRTAKQWFQQSIRKAPEGWHLRDVANADALRYLRLLEIAEKKAAAP
jgi:hypothetical protein